MKVSQLLTDASKWTQRRAAIDADGDSVNVQDVAACRFCLSGAIRRCYPDREERFRVLNTVINEIGGNAAVRSTMEWNDDPRRTFDEVRALVLKLDI